MKAPAFLTKPFSIGSSGINLFNPSRMLFLLCLFLLVLPKGGIKLGTIPITWGYLLLGMISLATLFRKTWQIQKARFSGLLCLLPFQLLSLGTIIVNGHQDLGMLISFFVSFFFLPWAFFFLLSNDIERIQVDTLFSLVRKGIAFLSIYGVFLFLFKQITRSFIEIPFLTVNSGDLGRLEEKFIDRSGVYKLISTYNNGNLYGICLLMLLPLYCLLEKNKWKKLLAKLSLFLTLSRTVWIGMLISEMLFNAYVSRNKHYAIRIASTFVLFLLLLFTTTYFLPVSSDFLFDSNLGGRKEQLLALENPSLFSKKPFYGIPDMVYLGVLSSFGIIGLMSFIFGMSAPLFVKMFLKQNSPVQKSIASGLTIYLIISAADGAILLLPTMAFFWFLSSLLLSKELVCNFSQKSQTAFSPPFPM